MVTGDYPATARSIAAQAGLAAGDTISFMADTNGFEFLSTGLQATITG